MGVGEVSWRTVDDTWTDGRTGQRNRQTHMHAHNTLKVTPAAVWMPSIRFWRWPASQASTSAAEARVRRSWKPLPPSAVLGTLCRHLENTA